MKRAAGRKNSRRHPAPRPPAGALGVLQTILIFPFKFLLTLLKRIAQVLLSIFVIVLHPSFRWLLNLLFRSAFVRNYIRPAIQGLLTRYYEPYFEFLRGLPPYWATFSIGLPLAVLEPAKLFATVLVAERPKVGFFLWLFLQGLSFVLIDKTWTAVRPQSRKIWLVSRLHAWGWLNVSYGKYWVTSSLFYKAIIRWRDKIRAAAEAYWLRLTTQRSRRRV